MLVLIAEEAVHEKAHGFLVGLRYFVSFSNNTAAGHKYRIERRVLLRREVAAELIKHKVQLLDRMRALKEDNIPAVERDVLYLVFVLICHSEEV